MALTKTFNGMKCRRVGSSGLWVSEVGLGLWKWGYPEYDESRVGEHEGFKILDRALELGIFHWDTANSYNKGSGNSQRLLGRYFASRGSSVREKVILATKVFGSSRPEHVMEYTFTPNQEDAASRVYIMNEVEKCLSDLQTGYIDLLYLHEPQLDENGNYLTPPEETWSTMDDLITQGKVRYVGVSNHSRKLIGDVFAAQKAVSKDSSRRIIVVQNWYNLLQRNRVAQEGDRGDEKVFLDFCKKESLSVIPFMPLATGLLTGRYRRDNLDKVSGRTVEEKFFRDMLLNDENLGKVEKLGEVAKKKGITMPQLAIAWFLSHEQLCSVIAGVTKMEHLEDNAKASGVKFTQEELDRIDAIVKKN